MTAGVFLKVLCALLENTEFARNLWASCLCPGSFHSRDERVVQWGFPFSRGLFHASLRQAEDG